MNLVRPYFNKATKRLCRSVVRAGYGLGLQPLHCWDRGFESLWRSGCSSLAFIVCCEGSGLCDELITRSEDSYRVCVCVCVCLHACDQ